MRSHNAHLVWFNSIFWLLAAVGLDTGHVHAQSVQETGTDQSAASDQEDADSLLEQLPREGVTQSDLESSTTVMQDLVEGHISEEQARSRLVKLADGKLTRFLSNQVFWHFFQRADPGDFIDSLEARGFTTLRLKELESSINFYFRPHTETRMAQWEFLSNTLFIPVEFCQPGTNKIRSDLQPHEINTLIHELDHADKDLRYDLLRMRGRSLLDKIHAGICWGAILGLLGLMLTTFLGNRHRLPRFRSRPGEERPNRLAFLTRPQISLGILTGSVAGGVLVALIFHLLLPAEFSDLRTMERQNRNQIKRIGNIINAHPLQAVDNETATSARRDTLPIRIRGTIGWGVLGLVGGAALGLALAWLGLGPRLLGEPRILKTLSDPWAMAAICALIGLLGLGTFGAWQTSRFGKFRAWEISAYYSGDCVQQVLEAQRDIAYHNTKLLYGLSLEDLESLRQLDEQGQMKLFVPARMYHPPASGPDPGENSLTQLEYGFPGRFREFGVVEPGFAAWFVGKRIEFPYEEHPGIFRKLFNTSLGLGMDRITRHRGTQTLNYRGLADCMQHSSLPDFVEIREQVRKARAQRFTELARDGAG
ncbi:MAG: hypothetical protein ACR2NP_17795 [Pirellulaceae bacterium]